MEDYIDPGLCPLCNLPLEGEDAAACPECGRPAHVGCWQRVGRCATKGCPGVPATTHDMTSVQEALEEARSCRYCGYQFKPFEHACPRCEGEKASDMGKLQDEQGRQASGAKAGGAAPVEPQLRSVDQARVGPSSDPFRRVTALPQDDLEQEAAARQAALHYGPVVEVENTSGGLGAVPREARGWSWGGLLLSPLWLAAHGLWGLLLVWGGVLAAALLLPLTYRSLLVGGMLLVSLYLGLNGNPLAWKARRFHSLEHFRRVQRAWAVWGVAVCFLLLVILTLGGYTLFSLRRMASGG